MGRVFGCSALATSSSQSEVIGQGEKQAGTQPHPLDKIKARPCHNSDITQLGPKRDGGQIVEVEAAKEQGERVCKNLAKLMDRVCRATEMVPLLSSVKRVTRSPSFELLHEGCCKRDSMCMSKGKGREGEAFLQTLKSAVCGSSDRKRETRPPRRRRETCLEREKRKEGLKHLLLNRWSDARYYSSNSNSKQSKNCAFNVAPSPGL